MKRDCKATKKEPAGSPRFLTPSFCKCHAMYKVQVELPIYMQYMELQVATSTISLYECLAKYLTPSCLTSVTRRGKEGMLCTPLSFRVLRLFSLDTACVSRLLGDF